MECSKHLHSRLAINVYKFNRAKFRFNDINVKNNVNIIKTYTNKLYTFRRETMTLQYRRRFQNVFVSSGLFLAENRWPPVNRSTQRFILGNIYSFQIPILLAFSQNRIDKILYLKYFASSCHFYTNKTQIINMSLIFLKVVNRQ